MQKQDYGKDDLSAIQAKFEAQKIAFAPYVFQAAVALRDLGILEVLRKHHRKGITLEELTDKTEVSEYGIEVLLDAGMSAGILYLREGKYYLTKTGFFLLTDKLTRINMDFVNDVCYHGAAGLKDSIKKEKPEGLKVFGDWPTIYHGLSELPEKAKESWFAFDHYYSDHVFDSILPIIFKSNPEKILDIGGNTGKFTLSCLNYNKDVHVTIADLPGQLNVAAQNIEKEGFGENVSFHPVDLLHSESNLPADHDIIWMSQFLDCFGEEDILSILKRVYEAMKSGSRVYILETYWDRQKFEASTYCLNFTSLYFTTMANGKSRMYHSSKMKKLLDKAGFKTSGEWDDLGVSHTLFECIKKD